MPSSASAYHHPRRPHRRHQHRGPILPLYRTCLLQKRSGRYFWILCYKRNELRWVYWCSFVVVCSRLKNSVVSHSSDTHSITTLREPTAQARTHCHNIERRHRIAILSSHSKLSPRTLGFSGTSFRLRGLVTVAFFVLWRRVMRIFANLLSFLLPQIIGRLRWLRILPLSPLLRSLIRSSLDLSRVKESFGSSVGSLETDHYTAESRDSPSVSVLQMILCRLFFWHLCSPDSTRLDLTILRVLINAGGRWNVSV